MAVNGSPIDTASRVYNLLMVKGYEDPNKMAGAVNMCSEKRAKIHVISDGQNNYDNLHILVYSAGQEGIVKRIHKHSRREDILHILQAPGVFEIRYTQSIPWPMVAEDVAMGVYRVLGGTGYNTPSMVSLMRQKANFNNRYYVVSQFERRKITVENTRIYLADSGYEAIYMHRKWAGLTEQKKVYVHGSRGDSITVKQWFRDTEMRLERRRP